MVNNFQVLSHEVHRLCANSPGPSFIFIGIDDNGVGREQSKQFKPQYEATYQSKGTGFTQSWLELDKLLNEREDSISIIDRKNELWGYVVLDNGEQLAMSKSKKDSLMERLGLK